MNCTWLSFQLNNTFINDYEITWLEYAGRLTAPECVRLKILSSLPLADVMQTLNTPAGLLIQNAKQSWTFSLMVFKVDALLRHELMGRNCYMLGLYPPGYDLTRNHVTPCFEKSKLVCCLSGRSRYLE